LYRLSRPSTDTVKPNLIPYTVWFTLLPAVMPSAAPALSIRKLHKTYARGAVALQDINLDIAHGELFALLGPNGAGKTTLIHIICGLVTPGGGQVRVHGHDIITRYRQTRASIGLVPQEINIDSFSKVWDAVCYSRGLFGKPPNPSYVQTLLRQLTLWDKRDQKINTLSGGMKRRLLIAKALAHEPRILFLDEPTAGVDVALRKDMWALVRDLCVQGITIVLTTHYIEEAEEMADRIGFISHGRLVRVQDKSSLMQQLGNKQLTLALSQPLADIPAALAPFALHLSSDSRALTYTYGQSGSGQPADPAHDVAHFLQAARQAGVRFDDVCTRQRSLEDIFVQLMQEDGS